MTELHALHHSPARTTERNRMSNEIREAVQMVLTRMETHPEDFWGSEIGAHRSRFGWMWNVVAAEAGSSYGLNEAEIAAIKKGYDTLAYRKFHDRVLESMLNDPKQDEILERQGSSLKYKPSRPSQYTDPRGVYGNAISAGQLTTPLFDNVINKTP